MAPVSAPQLGITEIIEARRTLPRSHKPYAHGKEAAKLVVVHGRHIDAVGEHAPRLAIGAGLQRAPVAVVYNAQRHGTPKAVWHGMAHF